MAPWLVQVFCRVLRISGAGCYQLPLPRGRWQAQADSMRRTQRYGTRRLRAGLRTEGHSVERYALRSWLHRRGLRVLSTRLD